MRKLKCCWIALFFNFAALCFGQGGFGGGMGMGNADAQDRTNQIVNQTNQAINLYLNGPEIKNILTPGEFSEWPLTLKAGQVVIAEARSDAFDPALEVVDSKGKVLASNDDRYPGDQRPLLLWHCDQDGTYSLRVRCFLNKAGGQFFLRYKLYDAFDLQSGKTVERKSDKMEPFLYRVPMKKGEVKRIIAGDEGGARFSPVWTTVISPIGLPDTESGMRILGPLSDCIIASVDGDYYAYTDVSHGARIKATLKDVVPAALTPQGNSFTGNGVAAETLLWTLPIKAGQFLRVSAPSLDLNTQLEVRLAPDFSKFDLAKPETNPFFPLATVKKNDDSALINLQARPRDPREDAFLATKDMQVWIATSDEGKSGAFTIKVDPAAKPLGPGAPHQDSLRVDDTNYWSFDAQAGDIISFESSASNFSQHVRMYGPHLRVLWEDSAQPDQNDMHWNLTASNSGRYLIQLTSVGNGGGGPYSISSRVRPAKEFGPGAPAKGRISTADRIQAWKFKVSPNQPLLLHWTTSTWDYDTQFLDAKGREFEPTLVDVNDHEKYGIIKVDEPTSLLVVLTPRGSANYTISLSALGPVDRLEGRIVM